MNLIKVDLIENWAVSYPTAGSQPSTRGSGDPAKTYGRAWLSQFRRDYRTYQITYGYKGTILAYKNYWYVA